MTSGISASNSAAQQPKTAADKTQVDKNQDEWNRRAQMPAIEKSIDNPSKPSAYARPGQSASFGKNNKDSDD